MEFSALERDDQSLPYEKHLRRHQYTLSKAMSPGLVESLFGCLSSQETVTEYEGQVIRSQPTDMQKASCLLQILIRKGRRACQLFYKALESLEPCVFQQVTGVKARCAPVARPHPSQDKIPPSTNEQSNAPTYIISIQNSTLVNCILGSNNDQNISSDQQRQLLQSSTQVPHDVAEGGTCECCQRGAAETSASPTSLRIHGSHLEYVIIGEGNSMTVEEGEESSAPEE